MVVLTTPNNPSGAVVERERMEKLLQACQRLGVWCVVDEAYADFTFDGAEHFDFDALQRRRGGVGVAGRGAGDMAPRHWEPRDVLVRLHTFSKSLGMAGWRCGYVLYPKRALGDAMTKIQDAIPTHASIASQEIARFALAEHEGEERSAGPASERDQSQQVPLPRPPPRSPPAAHRGWVARQVAGLERCRERLWAAVQPMGTVRTTGAFYFLVPLPPAVAAAPKARRLESWERPSVLSSRRAWRSGAPGTSVFRMGRSLTTNWAPRPTDFATDSSGFHKTNPGVFP